MHDIKIPTDAKSEVYLEQIKERLAQSQEAFRQKFETKNIEKDYAGLYCLLRLAQEPDEAGTEEAARLLRQFYFPERDFKALERNSGDNADYQLKIEEKRELSVNMFSDELDVRELKLDELNEKFFMYVFMALLCSQNRRILYQLLDVVNFYIMHETPYQEKVINPSIILWMLKIIDQHKDDADLCLLAAKTILKVVNNHQIVFDYQEMAIIKKFNKALDNIGGERSWVPGEFEEPETSMASALIAESSSKGSCLDKSPIDGVKNVRSSYSLDGTKQADRFKPQNTAELREELDLDRADSERRASGIDGLPNIMPLIERLESVERSVSVHNVESATQQ